jgi:hypothetical protein
MVKERQKRRRALWMHRNAADRRGLEESTLLVELHPINDRGVTASTGLSLRWDSEDVVAE